MTRLRSESQLGWGLCQFIGETCLPSVTVDAQKRAEARATGALSQFVGATVLAIRLAGDAIAMHLKMPAGDWHGDRDLTFYNIDESGAPPFVRIDGQYVPKEEL